MSQNWGNIGVQSVFFKDFLISAKSTPQTTPVLDIIPDPRHPWYDFWSSLITYSLTKRPEWEAKTQTHTFKYKLMGVSAVRHACVCVRFLSRSPPTSQWLIPNAVGISSRSATLLPSAQRSGIIFWKLLPIFLQKFWRKNIQNCWSYELMKDLSDAPRSEQKSAGNRSSIYNSSLL